MSLFRNDYWNSLISNFYHSLNVTKRVCSISDYIKQFYDLNCTRRWHLLKDSPPINMNLWVYFVVFIEGLWVIFKGALKEKIISDQFVSEVEFNKCHFITCQHNYKLKFIPRKVHFSNSLSHTWNSDYDFRLKSESFFEGRDQRLQSFDLVVVFRK